MYEIKPYRNGKYILLRRVGFVLRYGKTAEFHESWQTVCIGSKEFCEHCRKQEVKK